MRLALIMVMAGCGSDGPEPLISGSVQGSCLEDFTARFGYGASFDSNTRVLVFSAQFEDPDLRCGSFEDTERDVWGRDLTISVLLPPTAFDDVGVYTTPITVRGIISIPVADPIIACQDTGMGTVNITKVGDTIAGGLELDAASTPTRAASARGTFEVTRCPEPQ